MFRIMVGRLGLEPRTNELKEAPALPIELSTRVKFASTS